MLNGERLQAILLELVRAPDCVNQVFASPLVVKFVKSLEDRKGTLVMCYESAGRHAGEAATYAAGTLRTVDIWQRAIDVLKTHLREVE